MDVIVVDGIAFYAYGGVSEDEKRIGQRYLVDLRLFLDLAAAGESDNVRDTASYADAARIVIETAQSRPFNLLESAAARMSQELLARLPVQSVTVRLRKLLPPIDGVIESAGVEISRSRGA